MKAVILEARMTAIVLHTFYLSFAYIPWFLQSNIFIMDAVKESKMI